MISKLPPRFCTVVAIPFPSNVEIIELVLTYRCSFGFSSTECFFKTASTIAASASSSRLVCKLSSSSSQSATRSLRFAAFDHIASSSPPAQQRVGTTFSKTKPKSSRNLLCEAEGSMHLFSRIDHATRGSSATGVVLLFSSSSSSSHRTTKRASLSWSRHAKTRKTTANANGKVIFFCVDFFPLRD